MSARYEITCDDDVSTVTAPGGVTDSFSRHGTSTDRFGYGAIRQLLADLAALKELLAGEVEANQAFHRAGGALDGEDMPTFCARIIAEAEIGREWLKDSSLAKWFPLTAERVDEDAQEIAKLRARLAAIDAAPTVARVVEERNRDFACGPYRYIAYGAIPQGLNELIARPAKDGGT